MELSRSLEHRATSYLVAAADLSWTAYLKEEVGKRISCGLLVLLLDTFEQNITAFYSKTSVTRLQRKLPLLLKRQRKQKWATK